MSSWLSNLACSSLAGFFGALAAQPFDTIKVFLPFSNLKSRLQSRPEQYTHLTQTIFRIVRDERLIGLYKGILPSLLINIPCVGM